MRGPRTSGAQAGSRKVRALLRRFGSRWVAAALVAELVFAVIDATQARGSILTSVYLVPVLVVAVVETGERTATVALVASLLAVASGVWDAYFLSLAHLYRFAIVAVGGALGTVGAEFRTRAEVAGQRMELLARIAEVADGTAELEEALRRLARVLVPVAADLCEIVVFERAGARRVITHLAATGAGSLEERLAARPLAGQERMLERVRGGAALLERLPAEGTSDREAAEELAALREAEMSAAIYAPIRAGEEVLALLMLAVGPSGRRFASKDLRFATTVGTRAALAIQNAHLLFELREAQQRMEAIVGSLADAVTIRELSGRLIYANDAAMQSMGLSSDQDIIERDPEALFGDYEVTDEHGRPLAMSDLPSVKLLRGEDPEPLVLRFVARGTGREEWRVLKSTPLYDGHGQLEAAITVIEDITDTKRAELRSDFLARASEVLASSLDIEQTLSNVARLAVPDIADWCGVELFDETGQRQHVVAAHRDPAKVELAQRLREFEPAELDPEVGLGAVVRTGQPQLVAQIPDELLVRVARSPEHLDMLRAVGMRSALVVPLRGANRVLGAMTLVHAESGRAFAPEDVGFAQDLAARAAVAVANARIYSERARIASTLQHSLLPDALPQIPGWELASLYRPASVDGTVEVGGDFYDAFAAGEGWVMLIGDVTGKGVEAAAMTSLVRHGARFVADYVAEPADILERLDRSLRQQPALSLCTALCLHLKGDRIRFASAGHPLPLLVNDEGVRSVGRAGSVLGAFPDGAWPMVEVVMRPGEVLLLYTDGVTDTVGEAERFGEQRLRRTVAECGPDAPDELLRCLDTALSRFQVGAQADDTAALALRLAGLPVSAGSAAEQGEAVS